MAKVILLSVSEVNNFSMNKDELLSQDQDHIKQQDFFYRNFERWWCLATNKFPNPKNGVDMEFNSIKDKLEDINKWLVEELPDTSVVSILGRETEIPGKMKRVTTRVKTGFFFKKVKEYPVPKLEPVKDLVISFFFSRKEDALQFKLTWG